MKIRSATTLDADAISLMTGHHFDDQESRTQQHFKDEVDINTIVRKFGVTGTAPASLDLASYGDFSQVESYHDAMNALIASQQAFESVPAHIRKYFDNDPSAFVEFTTNPENHSQLKEWGLINPNPEPNHAPLDVVLDAVKRHQSVVTPSQPDTQGA